MPPSTTSRLRVALHQINPLLGRKAENLRRILQAIRETPSQLAVFPECALTGYGFESKGRAWAFAEPVPGPSTRRIAEACRASGAWAVVGLLERAGKRLFNSAALIGPDGVAGVYRKMHLPFLGVDRFASRGDRGFPAFKTPFGRVGLLICYDLSFPEAARSLKLAGARLLCVPTNWPMAAEVSCRHAPRVRAQENHLNVACCNRTGVEAGFTFRGESSLCDFDGDVLAQAGSNEAVLTAELDLEGADRNRVVIVPGRYELDRIGHRRPEFYARVTRKTTPGATERNGKKRKETASKGT